MLSGFAEARKVLVNTACVSQMGVKYYPFTKNTRKKEKWQSRK